MPSVKILQTKPGQVRCECYIVCGDNNFGTVSTIRETLKLAKNFTNYFSITEHLVIMVKNLICTEKAP